MNTLENDTMNFNRWLSKSLTEPTPENTEQMIYFARKLIKQRTRQWMPWFSLAVWHYTGHHKVKKDWKISFKYAWKSWKLGNETAKDFMLDKFKAKFYYHASLDWLVNKI